MFAKKKTMAAEVCAECKVLFKPETDAQPYRDLCSIHRAPKLALHFRKEKVMEWADINWQKIEPEAIKDCQQTSAALQKATQGLYGNLGQAAAGYSHSDLYGGFSGIDRLGKFHV